MESERKLIFGAKIINDPMTIMNRESPRNCISPIGKGIPVSSISILNRGPLMGRNSNTRKTPSLCLSITTHRASPHFSNPSVNRIGLEMPYVRPVRAPVVKGLSQEVSNLLSRVRIPAGAPLPLSCPSKFVIETEALKHLLLYETLCQQPSKRNSK